MFCRNLILVLGCISSLACYALDTGNESTADKADHFDFENFHKEKGITLWNDKKGDDKKGEDKKEKAATPDAKKVYDKGETLKVRAIYKLGNDPAQRDTQSLYEATETLDKQLNTDCPNGWVKEQEWHQPEESHFYLYYQATCM